jgi:hypothetical protein
VRIFIASTNDSDAFNGPIYILNVQGTLLIWFPCQGHFQGIQLDEELWGNL